MPIAIFSIIGYCLALAAVTRQDPDDMPPLVVPGLVLALYAGALVNMLAWTTHALLAAGILLLVWQLGAWIRFAWARPPSGMARPPLTPGIILFAAGSCALVVLAAPSAYWDWDEFSHWGLAIKELAAHHALWNGAGAVHFYAYPPGTTLFQYAMLIPGGFSEGRTHAAQGILLLAFLIPLIKRASPDTPADGPFWVRGCAIGALAFALVHLFGNGLFTLYVDGLLGVLLGSILVAHFLAPPFSRTAWIRALLGLSLLALIKDSGVLLALTGAGVIIVDLALGLRNGAWTTRDTHFLKSHRARVIALSGILVAIPLMVSATWHIRSQSIRAAGDMTHTVVLGHESHGQCGLTPEQRGVVARRFARALTTRKIGTLDVAAWLRACARRAGWPLRLPAWVCLSPLMWSILVAICLALQRHVPPCPPGFRRLALAHAVLGVGGVLYLAGLLWAYNYQFRAVEAVSLASFGRYVGTYGAAWLMVLVSLPMAASATASGSQRTIVGVCMAAVFAALAVETTVSPVWPPLLSARRECLRNLATAVRTRTAPDSRLYHVSQGSDGFDHKILRYELAPRLTEYWGWSLGTSSADAGAEGPVPAAEWAGTLAGCDYVLLGRTDAGFAERYGRLFADPATIPAHRLFAVHRREDGSLRLDPVD